MKITRDFKSTIMNRAVNDKKFRDAFLSGAVNEIRSGNIEAGTAMLKDYLDNCLGETEKGI